MARRRILLTTAALLLGVCRAGPSWAVKCLDDAGDAAQVAAARAAVDSNCDCFGVATHGQYVSCASRIVNGRAGMGLLRRQCKGAVKETYSRSVCGRDTVRTNASGPAVPCVAESGSSGKVSCAIKPLFACTWTGSTSRVPCLAATSCLEAADTNGDFRISGPGDSGDCATFDGSLSDNRDGTITDSRTGLMWEKLSDDGSIHDWNDQYTYSEHPIISLAQKLAALNSGDGFAGHADWRVPTIHELMTLVRSTGEPTISHEFDAACAPGCTVLACSCTAPEFYWSSTAAGSDAELGNLATSVSFSGGTSYALPTASALHVRAVRTAP